MAASSSFSGWHRTASNELRSAADLGDDVERNAGQILRHLDSAKSFEERALMAAPNTVQRMLAMGLLMTIEGMRMIVTTGLTTERVNT